jgi:carbon-monoxide dehydrogenase large subunit
MAHARILSVDVSAALEMPGVIAAYSGADLADVMGATMPCAWPVTPDMVSPVHTPLATDEVRYVGDGVAVVVARDRYTAADALEAIAVEYDQLPASSTWRQRSPRARRSCTATRAPTAASCSTSRVPAPTTPRRRAAGDDAVVVRRRFRQQRLLPTPMEPRGVVVAPIAAADEFTMWSTTQIPHILRVMLALTTGIPEHKLRVVAPDVGGGFGAKLNVYAEEVLALVVARKLGRPIKWTESRSENYQATTHGRDQIQDIEIASRKDGTLLGLKVELHADMGAYLQLITPGVPVLGAFMFPAIYKMPSYHFTCTGVFTTKTPTDAYRGAGRPEATYAIERIMDELAAELGRDPMELRKQNWIKHEEFPYEMIAGLTYDSGNYEAATEKAEQMFDMAGLRAEQAAPA